MKYKIIPNDIVKNMIEFLDEIQFEAASTGKPDDLQRINFCNYIISELMNGLDGFDMEDASDKLSTGDLMDRWDKIDTYRKDIRMDFPDDMSDEEWKKLIKQSDGFIDGWDKAYKFGAQPFLLAELFKILLLTALYPWIIKIRKII